MHPQAIHEIGDIVIAKFSVGERLTESEKDHLAGCHDCMMRALAGLDRKRKTQGPPPDAAYSRPSVQRALERANQLFLREFGISLTGEERQAKAS